MADGGTPGAWSFRNPTQLQFGPGVRSKLPELLGNGRVLIVTTRRGRAQLEGDRLLAPLAADIEILWMDNVQPNPGLTDFETLSLLPGFGDVATIVAFGGGSAIDSAKAAAALSTGRPLPDIVADPASLDGAALPKIHAVPTTAGTGSEVTPFATVWDRANRRKLSLNHPKLFPATAIVDPELTFGLPRDVTMATAFDALNQAFESVWNRNATPYTLQLAALAIERGLDAIPKLARDLQDVGARVAIAEASMIAGLCISQTRTAICHSISYPLTAHFGIPHGAACAFSMKAVAAAVLAERPDVLDRIALAAGDADAAALVARLGEVMRVAGIREQWAARLPSLEVLHGLAGEMVTPGRSDNFILPVDGRRLAQLIEASFD